VNNSNSKTTNKLSIIKNNENIPLQLENKRKNRNTRQNDKKYEIKSMEELFLDDEEEKDENLDQEEKFKNNKNHNNFNKAINLHIKTKDSVDFNTLNSPVNLNNINNFSHEDEILSSFENLNLEDFKNMSESYHSNPASNKKIIIQGVDYPVIHQINELLIKSQSQCDIKIEDYNNDLECEEEKNLFNLNNHLNNDIHIQENPIDLDECLENVYTDHKDKEEQLHLDEEENLNMIQSISDSLSVSSENLRQLELIRENKSRRPPTRYGNREDQVMWRESCQPLTSPGNNLDQELDLNSLKKMNTISHNTSTGNLIKHLNINNVLKNKNRFKPISSTGLKKMNRTFNLSSITERIHSPGSPSNRTLQNHQASYRIPLQQNLSNYEMNTTSNLANTSTLSYGNKKIYNLHNLHNLSNIKSNMNTFRTITEMQTTQYDPLNSVSTTKISSEFRKILKSKLNKNSDKIFANLKRLSNNTNNVSYNEQLVKNENLSNTVREDQRTSREITSSRGKDNSSSGKNTNSRAMSNPNLRKDNLFF
jgi:hypothetical protein